MSLRDQGRAIVMAALTEFVTKAEHPNVPYVPEEIAVDAIACAAAGATIVHVHSRNGDGTQAPTNDGIYREAMELIAKESDVLVWPTALQLEGDLSAASGMPHIWALDDTPPEGAPLRVAPFDVWRKGPAPRVDGSTGRLLHYHYDGRAERDAWSPPEALGEIRRRGLHPLVCCSEPGDVRWAYHVAREGVLASPVLVQVQLFGGLLLGPAPTVANLETCMDEWGDDQDVEWIVAAQMLQDPALLDALLDRGLERGAGIRVGIGDTPALHPTARNVDLVEAAVNRLARFDLVPARPADLVARLEGG
jgi:3-keto-5-aminohexanoate cleavage enzyme